MGRHSPLERALLTASFTIIGVLAAFLGFEALTSPKPLEEPAADPPLPSSPPPRLSTPPPRTERYRIEGSVLDVPGYPLDPGIRFRTRVSLRAGDRVLEDVPLSPEGDFLLEAVAPERGVRLRITTQLFLSLFDRSLDREVWSETPVDRPVARLGPLPLPRSPELGSVVGRVVDSAGAPLMPSSIELDPVEGTSTPNVGIARLGATVNHAANAPTEYRRGHQFTILHVPPGSYQLRVKAIGRLIPAVHIKVGRGETAVAIAERRTGRRLRGSVRDAFGRAPLWDVEVTVSTPGYAGPATRDPLGLTAWTAGDGAFDLPLPDDLPPGGVRVTFSRYGYQRTDTLVTAGDFGDGVARRDLELARD